MYQKTSRLFLAIIVFIGCMGCSESPNTVELSRFQEIRPVDTEENPGLDSFQHKELLLWPNGAPDAKDLPDTETLTNGHIANVHISTITPFCPPKTLTNGRTVIICPGGGYRVLAIDKEGYAIAKWLNSLGITAFVLKYRLTGPEGLGYHYPAQLNDLKKAIQIVRSRAQEYHIDPHKVGVMGFSAGGHLASTLGTHFDEGNRRATDPVARINTRPDFMILVYPHISLIDPGTSQSYVTNLLGLRYDPRLPTFLSNETRVNSHTPPTFLVHAQDDTTVPCLHSIDFYTAMVKAGVPGQLHLFEKGGHGFGLAETMASVKHWPDLCAQWLAGLD
jgi:acetyl esterase/lipase